MSRRSTKAVMLAAPAAIGSAPLSRERGEVPAESADALRPHESRIDRIARRAREIYEARGGNHGKAMEDWLQAEREIDDATGATDV